MKKVTSLILVFCLITSMLFIVPLAASAVTGNDIVNFAKSVSGVYYNPSKGESRLGPTTFDCSGFVYYVCSNVGISMSSGNTETQRTYGTDVDHSALRASNNYSNLQAGDLIFMDWSGGNISGHVGIYIGNGKMIHCWSSAGTPIATSNLSDWGTATGRIYSYVCDVRRVTNNSGGGGTTPSGPTNVSIKANIGNVKVGTSVKFDFTYENAGWAAFVVRKDGEDKLVETVTGKYTYSYTFKEPGKYHVQIETWTNDIPNVKGLDINVYDQAPSNVSITTDKTIVTPNTPVKFSFTQKDASYWYFIVVKGGVRVHQELATNRYECSYSFAEEGEYEVQLQTANDCGWTNRSVAVKVSNHPENVSIKANLEEGTNIKIGTNVKFDFTYENAGWAAFVVIKDGETKLVETVNGKYTYSYTFKEPGKYHVQFETWTNGNPNVKGIDINVYDQAPTNVSITAEKTYIEPNETVNFSFTQKDASYWYFRVEKENGLRIYSKLMEEGNSHSYTFTEEGKYKVYVWAINDFGRIDSTVWITVSNRPENVSIAAYPKYAQINEEVEFELLYENTDQAFFVVKKDGETEHTKIITGEDFYTYTFTETGTYNVQLETWNGSECEVRTIDVLVYDQAPTNVSVTADKTYVSTNETVTFTVTQKDAGKWELLAIKDDLAEFWESFLYEDLSPYTYSYTFEEEGTYEIQLRARNGCGQVIRSIWITVVDSPITSTVMKNNTRHTIETSVHGIDSSCIIIAVGYKDNRFVALDKAAYTGESVTTTLNGDIDEIKVMAWDSSSGMQPLCEAEVIPSSEWK